MSTPAEKTDFQLKNRPTKITVDLAAFKHNLLQIKSKVGSAMVLASVKADAYGHGLIPCCKALENFGVDYFGVAFPEEGVMLRHAGIKKPILIFGGLSVDQIDTMLEYDLDITAASVDKLLAIDQVAVEKNKEARVHLKIDTGMERIGTHWYNAEKILKASLSVKCSKISGIYSHFASADEKDLSFAKTQLQRFQEVLQFYPQNHISPPLVHMANSGAIMQMPEATFDMVRPGIALYGAAPEPHLATALDLKPVLRLSSEVVYFKVVKKGAAVSYGCTWHAPKDTRVVTVPIGYGDGFSRANSNVGTVLIRGKRYPVVGRVCMDQLMVDIGSDEAYNGDEVVLIGRQQQEQITVEEIAVATATISHEVLSALKWRIPREYL